MQAARVGQDTALAQIVALVETAQLAKAPIQAFADYVCSIFVPVVVLLAFLTWNVWCARLPPHAAAWRLLHMACPVPGLCILLVVMSRLRLLRL